MRKVTINLEARAYKIITPQDYMKMLVDEMEKQQMKYIKDIAESMSQTNPYTSLYETHNS